MSFNEFLFEYDFLCFYVPDLFMDEVIRKLVLGGTIFDNLNNTEASNTR